MQTANITQQARLAAILKDHSLVRAQELRSQGITAATISRAAASGMITRVARGLYQGIDSLIDNDQSLAEVAKKIPQGVICMVSALAYHGLTDQMPRQVWVAIGRKAWTPTLTYPPIRVIRFTPDYLTRGVEHHLISGVQVPIYSITKTLADVFRNSRLIDRSIAIEALKSALNQRKATPSQIIEAAKAGGAYNAIWPVLEALTSNG